MTFNELLNTEILENAAAFSAVDMVTTMVVSFILSLYIYIIYKKTSGGVMYSSNFGVSLISMCLITTLIILAITSNVALSLGVLGALSMVRFRTAIKEPLEIAFIFWSLSIGIITGAGLILMAVFGTLFISLILVVFVNRKNIARPYILIANITKKEAETGVIKVIEKYTKRYHLKAKTVWADETEIRVEIRVIDLDLDFVDRILDVDGVYSAEVVHI